MESYSVNATLGVVDNLSPALNRLVQLVGRLNSSFKNLTKVQADLDRMAATMRNMAASMAKASTAAGNFGEAAARAGRASAGGFNQAAAAASNASTAIARLTNSSRSAGGLVPAALRLGYAGSPAAGLTSAPLRLGYSGGGAGGGGGSLAGMAGGGGLPRGFRFPWPGSGPLSPGGGGAGGGGGGGGNGWRMPGMPGMPGGLANAGLAYMGGHMAETMGDSILNGVKKVFAAGSDWDHQIALAVEAGVNPAGIAMMNRAARQTALAVPGTDFAGNFKAAAEMRSVLGSVHEASQFLKPAMQYAQTALQTTGRKADVYTAIRAAEMLGWTTDPKSGAISANRLGQFMNVAGQAELQTHGRVDERVLYQLAQTGSLALKSLSESGLRNIIPLAAEMGGFRAGTGLQAIFRNIQVGVMPQRNAAQWEKYGLLNPADVTKTRGGGVSIATGGFKNQQDALTDPVGWIQKTVVPALAAAGMNRQQQTVELGKLFSTATGMRIAGVSAMQQTQIIKDVTQQIMAQQPGVANTTANANDPTKGVQNFLAGWNNLMEAFGKAPAIQIGRYLTALGEAMTWLGNVVQAHPRLTEFIVAMGVALGGLAVVIGAVLLVAAPIIALAAVFGVAASSIVVAGAIITAGIALVVSSFMLARKFNWAEIGKFFTSIPAKIGGLFMSLGAAIWNALVSMVTGLVAKVKSQLGLTAAPGAHPFDAPAPGAAPGPFQHFRGGHMPVQTAPVHDERWRVTHPDQTSGLAGKQAMNININLDGKQVAAVVLSHVNGVLQSHNTGPAGYDNSLGPARPSQAVRVG